MHKAEKTIQHRPNFTSLNICQQVGSTEIDEKMAKCLFPVTIVKVVKTNINVRVQESFSTCQAFLFIICVGSKSRGYDCPDLRRFIISVNLSHESRRASVHGFTPYCIVVYSLSFV